MEMICLWMYNLTNIDISFLCPVTVEPLASHLSKHLTGTTHAVYPHLWVSYLVLSCRVNRGLWGSLIKILLARCVYIYIRQPRTVQMHLRMRRAWAKSIQPQGLGCIKRELDHSDKHALPLPLEKCLALSFKDWRGHPVMLEECFHLRGMWIHTDGEMKGEGREMQRTWAKFECYCLSMQELKSSEREWEFP